MGGVVEEEVWGLGLPDSEKGGWGGDAWNLEVQVAGETEVPEISGGWKLSPKLLVF